jgi:hypothetical protein
LYVKAMLDGVASAAFASALGIGVIFSAVSVFLVQGTITLGPPDLHSFRSRVSSCHSATEVSHRAIRVNSLDNQDRIVTSTTLVYAIIWALI